MSTLVILKELCRNHRMIKRIVDNITKLRIRNSGKGSKKLLPRDEYNLKRIIAILSLLTNIQIFEKARIEGVKEDKRCKILCELSKKTPSQSLLTKVNILRF